MMTGPKGVELRIKGLGANAGRRSLMSGQLLYTLASSTNIRSTSLRVGRSFGRRCSYREDFAATTDAIL